MRSEARGRNQSTLRTGLRRAGLRTLSAAKQESCQCFGTLARVKHIAQSSPTIIRDASADISLPRQDLAETVYTIALRLGWPVVVIVGKEFARLGLLMSSVQCRLDRPRLVPILHADDCGLSAGITDGIVACHDAGCLRRTSVVVNGADWERAVDALTHRPQLSLVLHLNLFEGSPLSPPSEVDLLVDRRGRFYRRFVTLWAQGFAGASAARLRAQLRLELRRQIERFLEAFGDRGALSIDGHVHYHVIPAVFDELLTLCDEYPIATIRLPREPLYWPLAWTAPRPPIVNVAKNIVLRALCRRAESALHARSVQTTAAFIGVLATGAMTLAHVHAALDHLRRRGTSGSVEILFHPGRARPHEASLWGDRPELQAFYLSANRDREAELLCSTALRELLRRYALPNDHVGESAEPFEVLH